MIKFGTDGWRAVIAEEFTFANVELVVQAIVNYLQASGRAQDGLLVSYDARFLAADFAHLAAAIAESNGLNVFLVKRPTPTPMTAFYIKELKVAGGIMFTASHNPPEYQGIKFIPHYAGPATTEITAAIEKEINRLNGKKRPAYQAKAKKAEPVDASLAYFNSLAKLVNYQLVTDKNLKLLVDPLYGAAVSYLEKPFLSAGSDVKAVHNYFDPLFGNGLPDPSAERTSELKKELIKENRHLGLAVDGDADRFGAVDQERFYSPNELIAFITEYLLAVKKAKGQIVRSVATTHLLDAIAAAYNCELIETPVGFKWIGQQMLNQPVVIGGEESGGLSIGGHLPEKDGLLASGLLAEAVAYFGSLKEGMSLLWEKYGRRFSQRLDLKISETKKSQLLEQLKQQPPASINGQKVLKTNSVDGVKIELTDAAWLLIRASGTEPLIRVYLETLSEKQLLKLKEAVTKIISSV